MSAYAMKRVAAGAYSSTPWFFEPAKLRDDRSRLWANFGRLENDETHLEAIAFAERKSPRIRTRRRHNCCSDRFWSISVIHLGDLMKAFLDEYYKPLFQLRLGAGELLDCP